MKVPYFKLDSKRNSDKKKNEYYYSEPRGNLKAQVKEVEVDTEYFLVCISVDFQQLQENLNCSKLMDEASCFSFENKNRFPTTSPSLTHSLTHPLTHQRTHTHTHTYTRTHT